MGFLSAADWAELLGHIRREVCAIRANGRVPGALVGKLETFSRCSKTFSKKCQTSSTSPLLSRLIEEKTKNKGRYLP